MIAYLALFVALFSGLSGISLARMAFWGQTRDEGPTLRILCAAVMLTLATFAASCFAALWELPL